VPSSAYATVKGIQQRRSEPSAWLTVFSLVVLAAFGSPPGSRLSCPYCHWNVHRSLLPLFAGFCFTRFLPVLSLLGGDDFLLAGLLLALSRPLGFAVSFP
jgi:hypothetical protein